MSPAIEKSIAAAVLLAATVAWWSYNDYTVVRRTDGELKFDEPRPSSVLSQTIELPNGDGRVYVIQSPADSFGLDVHSCMLHVRSGMNSTIACTPQKGVPSTVD